MTDEEKREFAIMEASLTLGDLQDIIDRKLILPQAKSPKFPLTLLTDYLRLFEVKNECSIVG